MSNPIFTFNVEGHEVKFEASPFGIEKLSLDGNCVKSKRNLSLKSKHIFEINNEQYSIISNVNNLFTGVITCELYSKSFGLISSKFTKAKLSEKNKILSIILLLILCGFLGYLIPKLGAWVWSAPVLFIFAVAISMSFRERIYEIETKT